MAYLPENHPKHHTQKVQNRLDQLIVHLREDIGKVDDPKAEALFETTAEVLIGLKKAFAHYEAAAEEAWQ